MKEVNLDNTENLLTEVEAQMKAYYAGLFDTRQDIDGLVTMSGEIATIYWFIAQRESEADTTLEVMKSRKYLDIKKQYDKITIPELESLVKIECETQMLYKARLTAAIRALDRWLTHIAIRIKNLRKENADTYNQ